MIINVSGDNETFKNIIEYLVKQDYDFEIGTTPLNMVLKYDAEYTLSEMVELDEEQAEIYNPLKEKYKEKIDNYIIENAALNMENYEDDGSYHYAMEEEVMAAFQDFVKKHG